MIDVSIFSAFLGGLLTFFAPCTLPLVPAFIGFLGGTGGSQTDDAPEKAEQLRRRIFLNSLLFTAGFSLIFILFGVVSGQLGTYLTLHKTEFGQIGGVIVILFGFSMLGFVSFPNFFGGKKFPRSLRPGSPLSAFLIGLLFALGWSSCFGPILGTIIFFAGKSATALHGAFLLFVYSLGIAVPFLVIAYTYGSAFTYVTSLARYLPAISRTAGAVLIIIGFMIIFKEFGMLNTWATDAFGDWFTNLVQYM